MILAILLYLAPWTDMTCTEHCHKEGDTTVCESSWNDCREE